jgi:hypothetical protein
MRRTIGSFGIDAGCPTAEGQYEVDGAVLTLSAVTTGLDMCPAQPQYAKDVATTVLSAG